MMKEPEIKLFGRKISLPEDGGECSGSSSVESDSDRCSEASGDGSENKAARELSETMTEDDDKCPGTTAESQSANVLSKSDENSKTPAKEDATASENHPQPENEQSDAGNGQQKTLKKPDKIIPCPRCNSMDTKFCYYNNYNVNQPRHFCRSCQRYWTAGGTMRNVPVGAGRRKNKNSASNCHHITISEALQAAKIDVSIPNGFHHLKFKPNDTVLSFGPNSPLSESMASELIVTEKRVPNGVITERKQINNGDSISCKHWETIDDVLVGPPSVTMSNSSMEGNENGHSQPLIQNGFSLPGPCIPGIPWPLPWNLGIPLPAMYPPPGYPLPYFPAPYLNYSLPNSWNVPWLSIPSPATTNQTGTSSSPNSPLGKHSRNGELLKPNSSNNEGSAKPINPSENPIVVPKILRIDDPEEAAKSSIWDTLGIKYDSLSREGLFKALQPKADEKTQMVTASPLLQANPAALSRSVNFQETA